MSRRAKTGRTGRPSWPHASLGTPVEARPAWFSRLLRDLQYSEEAEPPADMVGWRQAVDLAFNVMTVCADEEIEPTGVNRTAADTVTLRFQYGQRLAKLECYDQGDLVASWRGTPSHRAEVWEVTATPAGIRDALAEFRRRQASA